MTDPFASEGNGDLGAQPDPDATSPTPADDQTIPDPQHTANQPESGTSPTAPVNPEESNAIQGNPSESTASPWAASSESTGTTPGSSFSGASEPTPPGKSSMPAPDSGAGVAPGVPPGVPTMPPPGAPPAGQPSVAGTSSDQLGAQPGFPADETAFGQAPSSPTSGWAGTQPAGAQTGMPPMMPPQGAYPLGAVPPGQVPPGSVPPGAMPPGQLPPGGLTGMPQAGQPKPYSPLPWIILAVVLSIGLLIMMALTFFIHHAVADLKPPIIETDEDTLPEFTEFEPGFDTTIEPSIFPTAPSDLASDISSLPTQATLPPAPDLPATPGAPEPAPASGDIPFTVPDRSQIQGDPYNDFNSPTGITTIAPMEIAVGETKEGKVGPAQMVPVKVSLTQGQKVTIAVKGELFGDYRFWMTSPANELVAYGDDSIDTETKGKSLDPRIDFDAKADGVYTILVNNSFTIAESAFKITVNE